VYFSSRRVASAAHARIKVIAQRSRSPTGPTDFPHGAIISPESPTRSLGSRVSVKTILLLPEEFPGRSRPSSAVASGCETSTVRASHYQSTSLDSIIAAPLHGRLNSRTAVATRASRFASNDAYREARVGSHLARFSPRAFPPLPSPRHERASRTDDVKDSSRNRSFSHFLSLSLSLPISLQPSLHQARCCSLRAPLLFHHPPFQRARYARPINQRNHPDATDGDKLALRHDRRLYGLFNRHAGRRFSPTRTLPPCHSRHGTCQPLRNPHARRRCST